MELELAPQRIFALQEQLTLEMMQQRAMDKRTSAVTSGIGSLLQRPKAEDVVLLGSTRRLDPFWHVAGRARYVYERAHEYTVPVTSPEVEHVKIQGDAAAVRTVGHGRQFSLLVNEHCVEELVDSHFVSAITGQPIADGALVTNGARNEIDDPSSLQSDGTTVIAPEHRASYVIRTLVSGITKAVQADTVLEEIVTLECTDLYYRPIRVFEFYWKPRDRKGTVDVDALTGQVVSNSTLIPAALSRVLSRDSIFDIGADAAGLLIPGGSIVVKVAKLAIDQAEKT